MPLAIPSSFARIPFKIHKFSLQRFRPRERSFLRGPYIRRQFGRDGMKVLEVPGIDDFRV
jgi:hypothetical protein